MCDEDCIILIQKQKLTVYRNGTILMTGVRNFQDGLYDLHLRPLNHTNSKTSINADNIIYPPGHAFIKNPSQPTTSTLPKSKTKSTRYNKIFDSFNTLIDDYLDDQVFDEYKPIVTKEKEHHANVILRKNKAKSH